MQNSLLSIDVNSTVTADIRIGAIKRHVVQANNIELNLLLNIAEVTTKNLWRNIILQTIKTEDMVNNVGFVSNGVCLLSDILLFHTLESVILCDRGLVLSLIIGMVSIIIYIIIITIRLVLPITNQK